MTRWIVLLFAGFFAGCATGPRYQNFSGSDAACIEGDLANFFKFFSEGEAHVHIAEVDGMQTASGTVCVSPGEHKFGIAASNNYKNANEYFDLTLEAGKKYRMRANLVGISFAFKLMDITDGGEVEVAEYKVKITGETQPAPVPIFVPAGKYK